MRLLDSSVALNGDIATGSTLDRTLTALPRQTVESFIKQFGFVLPRNNTPFES
jgi:hypothetical protein